MSSTVPPLATTAAVLPTVAATSSTSSRNSARARGRISGLTPDNRMTIVRLLSISYFDEGLLQFEVSFRPKRSRAPLGGARTRDPRCLTRGPTIFAGPRG